MTTGEDLYFKKEGNIVTQSGLKSIDNLHVGSWLKDRQLIGPLITEG